jgi:hypothetical protein
MCVVSNVGDDWSRRSTWPQWPEQIPFPTPTPSPTPISIIGVSRQEFDALKRQVEEMKRQLEKARAQDIREGNPDCEMEEKVSVLKQIAKAFDIELKEIFPE